MDGTALFHSPGASSSISTFSPGSPPVILAAGVGMVLGQDVVHGADGVVTSPIIVEALVPGELALCIRIKLFASFEKHN